MGDAEELGILEVIRDLKARQPFVPFRLVMTRGEGVHIESADLMVLGKSQVIYCYPNSDRVAHLRFNQIASVEELELKSGRRRK